MSEDLTGSYDSDLLKEVNARHHEAEPGVQAMRQLDQTEKDAQVVEDDNKFQATYDSSPVSSQGPSMEDYDYRGAYDKGTTFAPSGENGGVKLPNEHYKTGRLNMGGYDAQGARMKSTFPDEDGLIQQGAAEFGNGVTDSADGPDLSSLKPLTKSALGMYRDGASFEDFIEQVPETFSAQQKRVAWKNAEALDFQLRLHEAMQEDALVDPGLPDGLPPVDELPPILVKDLYDWSANEDEAVMLADGGISGETRQENTFGDMWLHNAQIFYDAQRPPGDPARKEMTAEQLTNDTIRTMAGFNQTIWVKVGKTAFAHFFWSDEQKMAFANLMHMYQRVENGDKVVVLSTLTAFGFDPWTLGIPQAGMKRSLRMMRKAKMDSHGPPVKPSQMQALTNIIYRNMPTSWPQMAAGGLYMGIASVADQSMEIMASGAAQRASDPGQATMAAQDLGGGATRDDAERLPGVQQFDKTRVAQDVALGGAMEGSVNQAFKVAHKIFRKTVHGDKVEFDQTDINAVLAVLGLGGIGLSALASEPDPGSKKTVDPGSPSA